MCGVELIWRWMTLELLESEAPASHLPHSLARSCRDGFNPRLSSAISARLKTEKSVPQKMASLYHKSLFNPASPCIKVQEEHPPRPEHYWEHSGVVNDDATAPISTKPWVQWLSFSLMRERDDAWCITSHVMVQSLSALCLRGCKSAQAVCFWWPF